MWIELISLVGGNTKGWEGGKLPPSHLARASAALLSLLQLTQDTVTPQKSPCTLPPALAEDVWCCCSVPGR